MGHLNVRFYLARAYEGLAGLAAALGMPDAFSPHAEATLLIREHHVRFLREAQVGAPLHMTAGVLELGESDLVAVQILTHSLTGQPCAAITTRAIHVTAAEGRAFPWSGRVRAAAEALRVARPAEAEPRGVGPAPAALSASWAEADRLGLPVVARGLVRPGDCDVFGRARPEALMGRVSDAAWHLLSGVFDASAADAGPSGGAMLECRFVFERLPRAGDQVCVRAGLAEVAEKTTRRFDWLLDPVGGEPWAVMEAVAAGLDLKARKLAPFGPAARAQMESRLVPGIGW
ncbi:thioesterase family protein [Caulobacter sp. 17J80-11]|nr:thioesterase family protein [Caulobacter sp. 17J80-11]